MSRKNRIGQSMTIANQNKELAQYGPKMAILTEKQRRFIIALLETGTNNRTYAASLAGYGDGKPNDQTAQTAAYRLWRDARVLEAIREETDRRIQEHLPLAAHVMIEIASDPQHKDRLKAADMLMNRGGLQVITRSEVKHIDSTMEGAIMRVRTLAATTGLDLRTLMHQMRFSEETIDATFREVPASELSGDTGDLEETPQPPYPWDLPEESD